MALQGWEKKQYALEKQLDKASEIINSLMISAVTGQGGSPGQLYKPPVTNPGRGEAVFGTEKGGQRYFEFLKAMGILYPTRWPKNDPNAGKEPFDNKGNDLSVPVPNHPDWAGRRLTIAGNPSFDINETPATRRTRKIRTLQERGVGGEAGNASDILKKGTQLPDIKAELNTNQLKILEEIPSNLNKRDPSERLKIMRDITGRVLKAQGGRGHTTIGDKLYLDPIKQELIPLPIDLESDKDKEIRHNQRYGFG